MNQPNYPLIDHAADQLRTASGKTLSELNLDAALAGSLTADDLQISKEALRQQAAIAHHAGYPQLAENLQRAAELTAVPNQELLRMYEVLRPGRATYQEMLDLAALLDRQYQASETAQFVREAAEVYKQRKLVKQ